MRGLESHYLNICIHCQIIILMMVFVLQNGLLGLKNKVNPIPRGMLTMLMLKAWLLPKMNLKSKVKPLTK